MDLSIVIVSYNTRDVTLRCLESVKTETRGVDYEIVVVDNASTDGSADAIAERHPDVRLIRNDRNSGFASGQNIGLRAARGRTLMILNSDILFVGNAAKILLDYLDSDPKVGAVGPQVRNDDGSIAPSARRAFMSRRLVGLGIVNRHFRFKRFLPNRLLQTVAGPILARWHDNYAEHHTLRPVDLVDGMCALFKREALERAGLFDEQFFFDLEINDLSNRVRAAGWQIVFNPAAAVIHLAHSSRKTVSRIVVETHRSELIYYGKYKPEYVPYIRRVTRTVVGARKRIASMRRSDQARQTVAICTEILALVDSFDTDQVWRNERIPRIDSAKEITCAS